MKIIPQYVFKHWGKRFLAFCLDCLGHAVTFPACFLRPPLQPESLKRILIIRLDHLGDALLTWPAIHALKRALPNSQIDFLTSPEAAELFEDCKEFGEILPVRHHWFSRESKTRDVLGEMTRLLPLLRTRHYDAAVDFRGDLRHILLLFLAGIKERIGYGITGGEFLLTRSRPYRLDRHQVALNGQLLETLGVALNLEPCKLPSSPARKNAFRQRLGGLLSLEDSKAKIVIQIGAGYPSKRWPVENYFRLIERISEEGLGVIILIGNAKESAEAPVSGAWQDVCDLRGKTTLADLPILFDSCHLFVGNDSGPAHLAALQGLDLVVLFSGTNQVANWHPWTPHLDVLSHPVECSPCELKQCRFMDHPCMTSIPVDAVYEKIVKRLPLALARRAPDTADVFISKEIPAS